MQPPTHTLHWALRHKENSPIWQKLQAQRSFNTTSKKDFFGQSPNLFVGRFGYPHINVGLLSVEEYATHDDPKVWAHQNTPIKKIIGLRTQLVNSRFSAQVKKLTTPYLQMSQEVAMADRPADVEINLNRKPHFRLTPQQDVTPFGPSVNLIKAQLTENPHIPSRVDQITSDTDLKANQAITELSTKKFDEHYLTKLLSAGTLGTASRRRLVPTRWSITAVDDQLGKRLLPGIRTSDTMQHTAFFGGHLGNYFLLLFLDDMFSYELFETYYKSKECTTDHEPFCGRTSYAENCAGGYYAARLPILEYLHNRKRQASVLALRVITDEYYAPLGVWVVREAVRKALRSTPVTFGSKELMRTYAQKLLEKRCSYDPAHLFAKSMIWSSVGVQKRLSNY